MKGYTHNNLLVAEDWNVIFNAFKNVSIQAFDYDTVYDALDNYIKTNNPEEYADIKKNGVMSIHMDMISRLAHSLSYRYEQAARENFFDTATLRESVIKLAKAYSYRPKRNRAANGLCRISSIRTTEPLFDVNGVNIANQVVKWNQSGDAEWFSKFIAIINRAFTSTNPFGRPLSRDSFNNIQHELYSINRVDSGQATYPFSAPVNTRKVGFEMVSSKIENDMVMEETPDSKLEFNALYLNDRNGNHSPNTGFFVQFKQGSLSNTLYNFSHPIADYTLDISDENVNETDVWLVELDDNNTPVHTWSAINNLEGQSVDYERIFNGNTKLYTIESHDKNRISLRFGNGVDTDIPVGKYNLWRRTSTNKTMSIKTGEIKDVPVSIMYYGADNQKYQLTIFLTNVSEVNNSEPEESIERIRRNAPLSHYTQERMINGEDYNIYPQTLTSLIKKQKTVNRTHSGHSRYMDIYDPSDEISFVTINAEDGYLLMDYSKLIQELDITFTTNYEYEVRRTINTLVTSYYFIDYTYNTIVKEPIIMENEIKWHVVPDNVAGSMGYFTINDIIVSVGRSSNEEDLQLIQKGTILNFEKDGVSVSTYIDNIENNGIINPAIDTIGNITLGDKIPEGALLTEVIPNVRPNAIGEEVRLFANLMIDEQDFEMYYSFFYESFVDVPQNLSVKVADFEFIPDDGDGFGMYKITIPRLRYVLGSNNDVQFYYKDDIDLIDPKTRLRLADEVVIEDGNTDFNSVKDTFLRRTNKSNDLVYLPD